MTANFSGRSAMVVEAQEDVINGLANIDLLGVQVEENVDALVAVF